LWVFPNDPFASNAGKIRFSGSGALQKIYPSAVQATADPKPGDTDLLLTTRLQPEAIAYLNEGGRVVLLEPAPSFAVEKTNFRLSSWDGGGPSGTVLDRNHPALREMPSDGWCDLQFYPLIQGSKTILLNPLPAKIEPLIRCIDRPTRLADRAYLFEASVGRGKLLVSGLNFARAIESKDPAAIFLFGRLVRYALGPDFLPKASIPKEALNHPTK
jgi:hypothetical protein